MKLKTFAIQGTVQELVELEALLVMFGYNKPDEEWNNMKFETPEKVSCFFCYKRKLINYFDNTYTSYKTFKASQIKEIIKYLES